MRRRRVAVAVAALAAVGLAVWLGVVRGRGGAPEVGPGAGAALGRAAAALAAGVPGWRRPARCREVEPGAAPVSYPQVRQMRRLEDRPLRVGVVADARGAVGNAGWAAREFERARVEVVVVAGGTGGTVEEIRGVLGALAAPGRPLLAIPGDREPVWAYREAIEGLRAGGAEVVDLSVVPAVLLGEVAVAGLPGVAVDEDGRAYGLVAGADGCGRADEDATGVAAALAAAPARARLLVSHAPPRQRGAGATDVALGGAHVGDAAVARAAAEGRADVVVHGLVDEAGGRAAAEAWTGVATALAPGAWGTRVAAAAGALDATPAPLHGGRYAHGVAVLVEIDGRRARVTPLTSPHAR